MDVADDVEGTVDVGAVVPGPFADDLNALDLVGAAQDVNAAEAFLVQAPERPLEVAVLPADDVVAEVPVGPLLVPFDSDRLGDVDDDGVDEYVVALGELDERGTGWLLDIGGVHDGEQTSTESGADYVVEDTERIRGGGLVVLVFRN